MTGNQSSSDDTPSSTGNGAHSENDVWRPSLQPEGRRTRLAMIIAGLTGVAAIILLVLNAGDITAFASQAASAKPEWLLLAVVSQISTYLCVAWVWRLVLKRLNSPLPLQSLFPISIAKLFADQAVPSGGVSGAAFFLFALRRRKVTSTAAFSTFVFATAAFFCAFLIAAVVSLIALAQAEKAPPALSASVSIFAAIFVFLTLSGFLFMVYRPSNTPSWITKIPGGEKGAIFLGAAAYDIADKPGLFAQATLMQLAVRMIDGVTLFFIFLAIASPSPLGICFIAVVIASV
ncbi:MAG: lysylphosphatidylglycerol synthase transmembrane domain-containing protein, partial [Hyphococcus sp.]